VNLARGAVNGPSRKYTLDTNLFIQAFRDPAANAELIQFHSAFAPFEYLHSIVVQELRAGVKPGRSLRLLDKRILDPFVRRGRLITPSFAAWKKSGDILRELARRDGLELRNIRKSFGNDILLAASCREAGVVLVTDNLADFRRIHGVLPFKFLAPWPIHA
jgi:predicted nucleic acid-binding protein